MKTNTFPTHLILRAAAHDMREHGAPEARVGRLLVLASVAEHSPRDFQRLAGSLLTALPAEPEKLIPGRIELAAYQKQYGGPANV